MTDDQLTDKAARAVAKAMTGGWPTTPKLIDIAAARAVIALVREHDAAARGVYERECG